MTAMTFLSAMGNLVLFRTRILNHFSTLSFFKTRTMNFLHTAQTIATFDQCPLLLGYVLSEELGAKYARSTFTSGGET